MTVLKDLTLKEIHEQSLASLPEIIKEDTPINDEDKELINGAVKALGIYLDLLHELPERKWRALSYANRIIWREIENQQGFLKDIVKEGYIPEMEKADDW